MARRGDGIYLRGRTWWLDFRHNGTRHQERIGRGINKTVAREIAQVKRAEILKGEAGIGKKRKDISFDEAADKFLDWVKANKRPKTLANFRSCIKNLSSAFGGRRLSAIHPFLLEKYKIKRLNEGAKVAVNRELSCLRLLVNKFIEWKKFEGENPVKHRYMVKENPGRVRFLEYEEEDRLLVAAAEPLRTIILTGIYAGLRIQSEALTLKKVEVDIRRRVLTVLAAHHKTGETKTVPIASELLGSLKAQMERSRSEYVFVQRDGSSPYKSIRTAFETACRRAKLTDVTPHVLRHTFASRLVMNGAPLRTVQELGGWKTIAMVERYSHLSEKHKQDAVELIGRRKIDFTRKITTPEKVDSVQSFQVVEK